MGAGKDAAYRVGPCSNVVVEDPTEDARECPQDYFTASNPFLNDVLDRGV